MNEKYADPFEAFKKKKEDEDIKKKGQDVVVEFKVTDPNKPKGFVIHRVNYGTGIPKVEVVKPPKFESHKIEKTGDTGEQAPRPKGFTNDRVMPK